MPVPPVPASAPSGRADPLPSVFSRPAALAPRSSTYLLQIGTRAGTASVLTAKALRAAGGEWVRVLVSVFCFGGWGQGGGRGGEVGGGGRVGAGVGRWGVGGGARHASRSMPVLLRQGYGKAAAGWRAGGGAGPQEPSTVPAAVRRPHCCTPSHAAPRTRLLQRANLLY